MNHLTLTLELGERSYPIHIGRGLLGEAGLVAPHVHGRQVVIVSNDTVAPLYLERTRALFAGFEVFEVILPDGEQYKTLEYLDHIYTALLERHCDRDVTLVALGGGVIGDMTGFAAASYQRGVNFIQLPTTLLSQVDSSVGGKTGVNHPLGKNMIGAFYQPRCVLIDTDTLDTLPDNELSAGLAEVIKYGLLGDAAFLDWLEQNMDALRARDKAALAHAIHTSCACKAAIVARDEREGGVRALLNLGHTFGHAIEASMGYGEWLHGEAVAAGMVMAADLSQRLGWISAEDVERTRKLIGRAGLPVGGPAAMTNADYFKYMAVDKKVKQGKMRFVLLRALGEAVVEGGIDEALIGQTLDACRGNE